MTTVQIKPEILKALQLFISTKETRYYLKGVSIRTLGTNLNLTSTDGHRLLTFAQPAGGAEIDIVLPAATVALCAKKVRARGFNPPLDLRKLDDKGYALGSHIFTPIDGAFPDFSRVIPRSITGEDYWYDPHYLSSFTKAEEILGGRALDIRVGKNGSSPWLISGDKIAKHNGIGVLIPARPGAQPAWADQLDRVLGPNFAAREAKDRAA